MPSSTEQDWKPGCNPCPICRKREREDSGTGLIETDTTSDRAPQTKELVELWLEPREIEALLFHYTKHGIPETRTGAIELADKLRTALDQ